MKTWIYNPLAIGPQDAFVDTAGIAGVPGAGDTVYLITLPSFTSNLGGSADLSPYVRPALDYTLDGSTTLGNVYLIGGGQGLWNDPGDAGTGPSGPVGLTVAAGINLTITGILAGQVGLGPAAAALDAAAAAAGNVPQAVADLLAAADAGAAGYLPQIIGTNSLVTLESDAAHQTRLTLGRLGEGITLSFQGGNDYVSIERADTGTVVIDAVITGFSGRDALDFVGVGDLVSTTADSFSTSSGNTYTFTNWLDHGNIVAMNDGLGGVVLTEACYAEGTRLLTDAGEVAIERLRVGDRLVSARDGVARPIVWLGHRAADGRAEIPVRIRAGAFGVGVPHRDLILSPDHAVFFEGALIPVRRLVDGGAVAEAPVDAVTYWHVELARHDIVLAEGLAAETYLDIGARDTFVGVARLPAYAASRAWEAGGCAPLTVTGEPVRRARAVLARAA